MPKPITATEAIALHVRALRQQRGLSVRQLAEQCLAQGFATLTQSALTNLERGLSSPDPAKRGGRPVTVEEVMGLAWVLGVSPIDLMVSFGEDQMQVAPGVAVHPFVAASWIAAEDIASPEVWGEQIEERTPGQISPQWVYRHFDVNYQHLARAHEKLADESIGEAERASNKNLYLGGMLNLAMILETAHRAGVKVPAVPRWMRDELLDMQSSGLFEPETIEQYNGPMGRRRRINLPPIEVQPGE